MRFPDTQLPKNKVADFYKAAKEMRHLQKRRVLGKCMFWLGNCDSAPIGSHYNSEGVVSGRVGEGQVQPALGLRKFEMRTQGSPPRGQPWAEGWNPFGIRRDNELSERLERLNLLNA